MMGQGPQKSKIGMKTALPRQALRRSPVCSTKLETQREHHHPPYGNVQPYVVSTITSAVLFYDVSTPRISFSSLPPFPHVHPPPSSCSLQASTASPDASTSATQISLQLFAALVNLCAPSSSSLCRKFTLSLHAPSTDPRTSINPLPELATRCSLHPWAASTPLDSFARYPESPPDSLWNNCLPSSRILSTASEWYCERCARLQQRR